MILTMKKLSISLILPVSLVCAETPVAQGTPAAADAAAKTVEQTASPEFIGALIKEVGGIKPDQAEAGAGMLFGTAKAKMPEGDFAKVAAAVPNMDGLLKAAPAAKGSSLGSTLAIAGALSKLGLKPDQALKFAPSVVKLVQSKAGAEVGKLLANALK